MSAPIHEPLVEARWLSTHFGAAPGPFARLFGSANPVLRAVDRVDLRIARGQIVGLVGESGSGKTTLGRTVLGLERPAAGEVRFAGTTISTLDRAAMRPLRRRLQMIPQDSAASLSPRMTVAQILDEVYAIRGVPKTGRRSAADLLAMVELGPEHAGKYPHQLSGGQAKRVAIARALSMEPDFIVADAPTYGLDVSAVAAIINLLVRLRGELGLSLLVITHDLDAVAYMADVIAVMYLGRIVESGPAEALVDAPRHPYTQALLASVARPGRAQSFAPRVRGEVPSPRSPPPGCRFHTRCLHARPRCRDVEPQLEADDGPRQTACHFWREITDAGDPTTTMTGNHAG